MVNRGAGYGLEVPYVFRLYGPKAYIDKMKEFNRRPVCCWIACHFVVPRTRPREHVQFSGRGFRFVRSRRCFCMAASLRGAWGLSAVRRLEVVRISEVEMY